MKLSEIAYKAPVLEAEGPTGESAEIRDVLAAFSSPARQKAALNALWGKDRLEYNGMKFFSGNNLGPAYKKAEAAAEEAIKQGTEVRVSIPLPGNLVDAIDPDAHWDDLEYEATIADKQEVYVGYSPKNDQLYIGYDIWLDENDFNDAWDREFENAFGERFDDEDEDHQALFDAAWKQYRDYGHGILFELNDDLTDANVALSSDEVGRPGMFYQSIHNSSPFKNLGLVDIRLD